jgi:Tfp pilus assembly protein PilF
VPREQAFILYNLGRMYCDDLDKPEQGIQRLQKALESKPAEFLYGAIQGGLGLCFAQAGQLQQSELAFTQAIQVLTSSLGADHERTKTQQRYLAALQNARRHGEQSIKIAL